MPRTARIATLFLRVTLPDGKRPYLKPATLANGRLRAQYALVDGKAQPFPEGIYWLRHTLNGKATFTRIGASAEQAMQRQREHEAALVAVAAGLSMARPEQDGEQLLSAAAAPTRMKSMKVALDDWEKKLKSRRRTDKTIKACLRDMAEFVKETGVKHVEAINRKTVVKYIDRLDEYSAKTVENRVGTVRAFMYFAEEEYDLTLPSLTKMFIKNDRPRVKGPDPQVYTPAELKALFAGCTDDERVLWEFFLETGFREQEVEYTTWKDLDLTGRTGLANLVGEKEVKTPARKDPYKFRTKNGEGRVVPLSEGLVERLLRYKAAHHNERRGPLVFALENGGPDGHMLRKLKECAFRLGLNCGECVNKQKGRQEGKTCEHGPWCSHWQLHAFRRTIASAWHHDEKMPLDTVRTLLGHSNLETTRHYLERLVDVREETTVMASSAANRFR